MPDFDLALLHAGEHSGRLDVCFRLLSKYYSGRADNIREFRGILAYPAFIFHFAVFIIPFPALFQSGNLAAYLSATLGVLIPIYIALFALSWASSGTRGSRWRRMIEAMEVACDEHGRPKAKLHGLRMLNPQIFTKLPLHSADSTNAERNSLYDEKFTGIYAPRSRGARSALIADYVESHQSPSTWRELGHGV